MKRRFNYLQHEDAVKEILKYRESESEKTGGDIGFASAAIEWIKKHGEEWKKENNMIEDSLTNYLHGIVERRAYRRFKTYLPIKICFGGMEFDGLMKKFNHVGVDIITAVSIPLHGHIEILIPSLSNKQNPIKQTVLNANVLRITHYHDPKNPHLRFQIFTHLDKESQEKIISNKDTLMNN